MKIICTGMHNLIVGLPTSFPTFYDTGAVDIDIVERDASSDTAFEVAAGTTSQPLGIIEIRLWFHQVLFRRTLLILLLDCSWLLSPLRTSSLSSPTPPSNSSSHCRCSRCCCAAAKPHFRSLRHNPVPDEPTSKPSSTAASKSV